MVTLPAHSNKIRRIFLLVCIIAALAYVIVIEPTNPRLYDKKDSTETNSNSYASKESPESNYSSPPRLDVNELYHFRSDLGGYLFNENGRTHEVSAKFVSSLVHTFSPHIEREVEKRLVDPPHTQVFFANSPAVLWRNGELVLVSRVWLDRERYEAKNNWPANHFADNYFYTQKFDKHMKPVSNGSIIGIAAPKQWWTGDGPIEPRLLLVQNRLLISFNTAMMLGKEKPIDTTIFWDMDQNLPIIPEIKGGSPMDNATEPGEFPRDKHWMALILNEQLFFVHNLDPLRVLKCNLDGYCEFVFNDNDRMDTVIFHDGFSHLRGGTPFVEYKHPYYISVAHTLLFKKHNWKRFYVANLVVLNVEDPYRIVYVSDHLRVHDDVYAMAPQARGMYIEDGFIFPVGLILEDPDTFILGVHVNDNISVLLRFRGLNELMEKVMELDKRQAAKMGPPPNYIQAYLHERMQNLTNIKYVHKH